ncbi:phosphotransferase [Chloroflexi bacterium TSY]|nr:phosphotransferase [Chloroflexi bacterium TSY]
MIETTEQWTTDVFGILPHPTANRILLLVTDDKRYQLPSIQLNDYAAWTTSLHYVQMQHRFRQIIGTEVDLLYRPYYEEDRATQKAEAIHVLEPLVPHPPDQTILPPSKWIGLSELDGLCLIHQRHYPAIKTYLTAQTTGVETYPRPPWTKPGWRREAVAWIKAELARLGEGIVTAIDVERTWEISIVLRVTSEQGIFYFKSINSAPIFGNEPLLAHALNQRFPQQIPPILSFDQTRRWMLTADWGTEIGVTADLDVRKEALTSFAQIQVALTDQIDELLAIGCTDRRLEKLPAKFQNLLQDDEMMSQLSAEARGRCRELLPQIQALCRQAATYAVPPTLIHGDLHGGNIALGTDGQPFFFDWGDASLSHPFIDLFEYTRHDSEENQALLCQAYLAVWSHHESTQRLWELWKIVRPLAALYYAVNWRVYVALLEPAIQEGMKEMLSDYVRLALSLLEE